MNAGHQQEDARRQLRLVVVRATLCIALGACGSGVERPDGWTEATHGNDTSPNYDLLFAMNTVHTIEIAIAPSDFKAMQDDLADILGEGGGLPGGGGPPPDGGVPPGGGLPPEATAACDGLAENAPCEYASDQGNIQGTCQSIFGALACIPAGGPGGGGPGGGMGGGGDGDLLSRDPIYVPVELRHDGHTWRSVGMRFKGNSSLAGSLQQGNGKIAFRLDLDEFEDRDPAIADQRFYGFKKLTFSSNWSDDSLIRDAYVSEVLRDRGIPAARCAFYRVVVDVGNGPEYWGLYTLIEDPADGAMLDAQLGGRGGNLYKPEGTGADWKQFDSAGFTKKTNEDAGDWSDVEAAIAALHADASDAAAWRAALEARFDVDLFLTWLAVNTTIVNWDSYGRMAHNYYLYASPGSQKLRWIPWDHNLSMMATFGGGGIGGGPPSGATDALSEVLHTAVSSDWPLISLLLADPVYQQRYREKLEHALGGLFATDAGPARMRELHQLIQPHVVGPEGERPGYTHVTSEQAFLDSIDGAGGLAAHVSTRHARVREALGGSSGSE